MGLGGIGEDWWAIAPCLGLPGSFCLPFRFVTKMLSDVNRFQLW